MRYKFSLAALFLALCSLSFAQSIVIQGNTSVAGSTSGGTPLIVVTTTLPAGTQGVPYSSSLVGAGGVPCASPTYTWTVSSGSLPAGLGLNPNGLIAGVPTGTGTSSFVVQVQDCTTPTPATALSGTLSITINPVTPPPPPSQVGENGYCTSTTDASCFAGSQTDVTTSGGVTVTVNLPQTGMYTGLNGTPAPGGTVTFTCGGNLQTAINSLTAGQTLIIPAICSAAQDVISGNFTLPVVSGANASNWNIIETDQTGASNFPAEHTQATPCAINQTSVSGYPSYTCSSPGVLMPQISCANSGDQSCFTTAAGAHFWRVIGLEIKQPDTFNNDGNGLVDLTAGSDHIIFDRVLMHGPAVVCSQTAGVYTCTSHDLKNGVQLQNSTNVAVINSWMYDIACPQGTCTDSHAFGGGNGTLASNTYKVFGSMVSAAGENFFQGGNGSIGALNIVTPTDFEIRNNHFFKPVSYALCTGCSGQHVEFKNNLEIKNGQRLLIEGNVFENNWQGWQTDQAGYALHINAFNQNNSVVLTATSDGAGNLTATSGSFGTGASSPVSSLCAVAGHCQVKVGNTLTTAQTQTDATHISVSPAPAAGSGLNVNQCTAGLNPNAITTDIAVRFNDFRNTTNGPEFASVPSDCGDPSLGLTRFTMHDNLLQGMNSNLNNANSLNVITRCAFVFNDQTSTTITNFALNHNTCAIGFSGKFGNSGFEVSEDGTNTTHNGSDGAYLSNRIVINNIGPAGGIFTNTGGLYPGGALAGLKQQSCTPPVTGTTCTWTYSNNALGQGLWTNQTFNSPFPSTNQTCGGVTCFPTGSAFTSSFTNYSGPAGQNGYLGNYVLAPGSNYLGAGSDGKDIGVSDWTQFNNKIAGAFSPTTYTAASITTGGTLPSAISGAAYSKQLAATSASDMQVWTLTSGTLPTGLTLSFAGGISGTPSGTGTSTFTLQMMDAAQQYATKTFSLTVANRPNNNFVQVTLNAGMTSVTAFDFHPTDNPCHIYAADQLSGFWLSTDCGSTWTQKNSGLPTNSGNVFARSVFYDSTHSDIVLGLGSAISGVPVKFFLSSDEGTTWAGITNPGGIFANNSVPAFITGCAVAGNGNLLCGGFFGGSGSGGRWWSSNNGTTTNSVTVPGNGTCPAPGGVFSFLTDAVTGWTYSGDEQCGLYVSKDNGQTWNPCGPPDENFGSGNPRVGNMNSIVTDVNDNIMVVGQGGVFRQSNSSCPYTFTNPVGDPDTASGRTLARDSLGTVYYGHGKSSNSGFQCLYFASTDNGVTWSNFCTNLPASGGTLEGDEIKQNPVDGQMYVIVVSASANTARMYKTQ